MSRRLCLTTLPDAEQAEALARVLVKEGLAACVNILPGARSIYRWHGQVQADAEVVVLIKTDAACLDALEKRLLALHPYDTPAFTVLAVSRLAAAYDRWLTESLTLPNPAAGPDRS